MHEVRESNEPVKDKKDAQRNEELCDDAKDPLDSVMSGADKIDPVKSGPIPYEMLLCLQTSKKM